MKNYGIYEQHYDCPPQIAEGTGKAVEYNELVDKIDRLPIELSPKRSKHAGRCCVHKERAVWKYKSLPLLGLDMEDETDELTPIVGVRCPCTGQSGKWQAERQYHVCD